MRKRQLKRLWARLHELQIQSNSRDQLLLKLGSAKKDAGRAWYLVKVDIAKAEDYEASGFQFSLRKDKLRDHTAPGRSLSTAFESDGPRSGDAVAALHSTH